MSDHLSPISLARFQGIASKLGSDPPLDPPRATEAPTPVDWLRQYISAYLSDFPLSERLQRLLNAVAGAPPLALFGEPPIAIRDFEWSKGFSVEIGKFSETDRGKVEQAFSGVARDLFEKNLAESLKQTRAEGETASTTKFDLERQSLKKEVSLLEKEVSLFKRRIAVLKSKIVHGLLFTVLLVGSLSFTVWFAGLLGPQATQVTIEYNIGELIAGILGGAGAAAAGLGYAAKALRRPSDGDKANE